MKKYLHFLTSKGENSLTYESYKKVWDELHFMREDTFERKQAQSWGQYHSAKMPKFLWHFQKCSVLQKLLRLVAKLVEWSRISQQFIAVLGSNPAYI